MSLIEMNNSLLSSPSPSTPSPSSPKVRSVFPSSFGTSPPPSEPPRPGVNLAPSAGRHGSVRDWNNARNNRRAWFFSRTSFSMLGAFTDRMSRASMFQSRMSSVRASRDWGAKPRSSQMLENMNEQQTAAMINDSPSTRAFPDVQVYAPEDRPSELDPDGDYEEYYAEKARQRAAELELKRLADRRRKRRICIWLGISSVVAAVVVTVGVAAVIGLEQYEDDDSETRNLAGSSTVAASLRSALESFTEN